MEVQRWFVLVPGDSKSLLCIDRSLRCHQLPLKTIDVSMKSDLWWGLDQMEQGACSNRGTDKAGGGNVHLQPFHEWGNAMTSNKDIMMKTEHELREMSKHKIYQIS